MGACLSFGSTVSNIAPFSTWNSLTPSQKLNATLIGSGGVFILSLGIVAAPLIELIKGDFLTAIERAPVSLILGGVLLGVSGIALYKNLPLRGLNGNEALKDYCWCDYLRQEEEKKSESFFKKVWHEAVSYVEGGLIGKILSYFIQFFAPPEKRPDANCAAVWNVDGSINDNYVPSSVKVRGRFITNTEKQSITFTDSNRVIYLNDIDDSKDLAKFEAWDNIRTKGDCSGFTRYFLDSIAALWREDADRTGTKVKDVQFFCDAGMVSIKESLDDGSERYDLESSVAGVGDYLENLLESENADPFESLVDFGVLAS